MRVVVAEPASAGSLRYLLEAEGFQVVGCASDEGELERVLDQDLHPDVIVLDGDVVATTALVARHHEPDAHVIVIWPDGVQPPRGADRVSPALVYEELGPTIRRRTKTHPPAEPIIVLPDAADVPPPPPALDDVPTGFGRAASRVSLTTVTLIAAILLTMGVSFALNGYHVGSTAGPSRTIAPRPTMSGDDDRTDLVPGRGDMHALEQPASHRCTSDQHAACAGRRHRSDARRALHEPPAELIVPDRIGGATPPTDPGGDQGNGGHDGDQGNQNGQGNQNDDGQGDADQDQDEQGQADQGGNHDQGSDEQSHDDQGDGSRSGDDQG